jgi:hypothetical protein
MWSFRAQGATEYLVLLAVVLIIALVAIALLGFFPGTASDAQITQSQIYWKSASPIAIDQIVVSATPWAGSAISYLKVSNKGAYPVRVTAVVNENGFYTNTTANAPSTIYTPISAYLGPGEVGEIVNLGGSNPLDEWIWIYSAGPAANCSTGTISSFKFGFEYATYVEGNALVKREYGKVPITIRCRWYV